MTLPPGVRPLAELLQPAAVRATLEDSARAHAQRADQVQADRVRRRAMRSIQADLAKADRWFRLWGGERPR